MPIGHQVVHKVKKDKLVFVNPGDKEPEIDMVETLADEEQDDEDKGDLSGVSDEDMETVLLDLKKREKPPLAECMREFCDQLTQSLKESKVFNMQWGKNETDKIEWRILMDSEHMDIGNLVVPSSPSIKELNVLYDCSMVENFLALVFPSIAGHAKLIDKFHSNPRSSMYVTVKCEKIMFFNEASNDPDEK